MDEHNSKNQKLNEENYNIIGSLHDSLLQHILSFLPTREAVRTSVLSKRWQFLWTSIPNLDFAQGYMTNRTHFLNFVERVLVHRDVSNVQKFSLSCNVLCEASRISSWISAVVRRGVKDIDLCLDKFKEPFVLPYCLFTSESLTSFDIDMETNLKLPPTILLSNLKILTLRHVVFPNDNSTQQLFSGCPLLEELTIDECSWVNIKAVTISAPRLWSLIISDYYTGDQDREDFPSCQVMIFGTSLRYFEYNGELPNEYCIYNSSLLVDASIHTFCWGKNRREVAYRLNKLLRGISNLKELTLSGDVVEVLMSAEELLAHLPVFNSLTKLELVPESIDFDSAVLLKMLHNSPRLQFLVFIAVGLSMSAAKDGWKLDLVPSCFSSHLKKIQIYDFSGDEDELSVVKILLENATVLERMVLNCAHNFSGGCNKQREIHEQLKMYPRGSTSCEILFS